MILPAKGQDTLSRASKVLIDKGIQFTTWISHAPGGDLIPLDSVWEDINLSGVTFYSGSLYNTNFFERHPDVQWSIENAPFASQITSPPLNQNDFLNSEQISNIENLIFIGFGDEEEYSVSLINNLKEWFDLSKMLYPNVLVHNNRCHSPSSSPFCEWSYSQLNNYFTTCKPDILTFDWYYFSEIQPQFTGGTLKPVFDNLHIYRKIALGGYDGSGLSPVAFGQYLLGYKTGNDPQGVGNYIISESQIKGVAFATLTMGGKWLDIFRYQFDSNVFIFHDANGNRTEQYWQYSDLGQQVKNLSPYIVRLNSKNVYFLPGEHIEGSQIQTNPKPDSMSFLNISLLPNLIDIDVDNLGQLNSGLKGDVIIGEFEPLNGLNDNFLPSTISRYYMIMNGLTWGTSGIGNSESTTQRISIKFRLSEFTDSPLKKISRTTGEIENVPITQIGCNEYIADFYLGGGEAELIFWDFPERDNIAENKSTKQGSTHGWGISELAVDNNVDGNYFNQSVTHTLSENWWEVDLGGIKDIKEVQIWNRTDCCEDRLRDYYILFSTDSFSTNNLPELLSTPNITSYFQSETASCPTVVTFNQQPARFMRIQLQDDQSLSLAEVKIYESSLFTVANEPKENNNNLLILPNPAINNINIQLDNYEVGFNYRLLIYDIRGLLVSSKSIVSKLDLMNIDIADLPTGMYIISLNGTNFKTTSKFIKI